MGVLHLGQNIFPFDSAGEHENSVPHFGQVAFFVLWDLKTWGFFINKALFSVNEPFSFSLRLLMISASLQLGQRIR